MSKKHSTPWKVHSQEYLDSHQASILAFHNAYPEGNQGGIEIIQHNHRLASCGFLYATNDKGEGAEYPRLVKRTVGKGVKSIELCLKYEGNPFRHRVRLEARGDSVHLSIHFDKTAANAGLEHLSFRINLFPSLLWGKSFLADGAAGILPRDVSRPVRQYTPNHREIEALGEAAELAIAPEDEQLGLSFRSLSGRLALRDGRHTGRAAWFTVAEDIAALRSGEVLRWVITPHRIRNWRKPPMIAVSQVGYHPAQPKQAVIELDPLWQGKGKVVLYRTDTGAGLKRVLAAAPRVWGNWLRYKYAIFDFSAVQEEGTYFVRYAGQEAGPFIISHDIYRQGVWQPTLSSYFPVQMCHMEVWEGNRLWHAPCHMDDAMQAPFPLKYIDGYRQGPKADTPYKPYQHVPHLDRGGWHDAGDTDLAAGSQSATTYLLCLLREEFGAESDQTTVAPEKKLVRMYRPDGTPDIVEQVAHGVECLLGGYRAVGHSFCGIIASDPKRYYQHNEISSMTDNRVYDPKLAEGKVAGNRSGKRDDRFVFTNRDTALEYNVSATLAAASRVLRGHFDDLADEALGTAEKAWTRERKSRAVRHRSTYVPWNHEAEEIKATTELYITTRKDIYRKRLRGLKRRIIRKKGRTGWAAWPVLRVAHEVFDEPFLATLKSTLRKEAKLVKTELAKNPFGVFWRPHIWGIGWSIQSMGVGFYYLNKLLPDLYPREWVFSILNWVLGCHAGNSVSFVSGVGTKSLTEAFGINRVDYSYIHGGNASGTALIKPDFPELQLNYPWSWQQSEYVMPGAASYIFIVLAADALLRKT